MIKVGKRIKALGVGIVLVCGMLSAEVLSAGEMTAGAEVPGGDVFSDGNGAGQHSEEIWAEKALSDGQAADAIFSGESVESGEAAEQEEAASGETTGPEEVSGGIIEPGEAVPGGTIESGEAASEDATEPGETTESGEPAGSDGTAIPGESMESGELVESGESGKTIDSGEAAAPEFGSGEEDAAAAADIKEGPVPCTEGELFWTLDAEGILRIYGQGTMEDWWDEASAPWAPYGSEIRSLVVEDGVKNIGDYSFANCICLSEIEIAPSVEVIGAYAFSACGGLTEVTVG